MISDHLKISRLQQRVMNNNKRQEQGKLLLYKVEYHSSQIL